MQLVTRRVDRLIVVITSAATLVIEGYLLFAVRPLSIAGSLAEAYAALGSSVVAIIASAIVWVLLAVGSTLITLLIASARGTGLLAGVRSIRNALLTFGFISLSYWLPMSFLSVAMEQVVPYETRPASILPALGIMVVVGALALVVVMFLAIAIAIAKRRADSATTLG